MKIASKRKAVFSLESVAMTDIVLNMFIFFFISFSLLYTFNPQRVQKLEVKLPKASSASVFDKTERVTVTLTNEGMMYLDQEQVSLRQMKEKIRVLYAQNPQLVVVLRSDKLVSFKNVVGVLDALTELGLTNLNIAAVKE
jgi:biopolymer transport protein ExbD